MVQRNIQCELIPQSVYKDKIESYRTKIKVIRERNKADKITKFRNWEKLRLGKGGRQSLHFFVLTSSCIGPSQAQSNHRHLIFVAVFKLPVIWACEEIFSYLVLNLRKPNIRTTDLNFTLHCNAHWDTLRQCSLSQLLTVLSWALNLNLWKLHQKQLVIAETPSGFLLWTLNPK